MNRRRFLHSGTLAMAGLVAASAKVSANGLSLSQPSDKSIRPLAITMWDFSWLERRWAGAGFENWELALQQLTARGYNAVRIDAYPHLVANNPTKVWTLKPVWTTHDWGSPAINKVQVQPNLIKFISVCAKYGVKVGLSTWYREDTDNVRMKITSPDIMADNWIATLKSIEKEGLLDSIFYVDLCNEWPGDLWTPYFKNNPPESTWGNWHSEVSMNWMKTTINRFKSEFPAIPVGFSFDFHNEQKIKENDLSFVDYGEPHLWMSHYNSGEFYNKVGYNYDLFKPDSYNNLAANGQAVYESNKSYWQKGLSEMIAKAAELGRAKNLPLITTECWGVVDYKDWPLLEWDWIKELCAMGVNEAIKQQQWVAIASSNFCAPQFSGMWTDVDWHLQVTDKIKAGSISSLLHSSKLVTRIGKTSR